MPLSSGSSGGTILRCCLQPYRTQIPPGRSLLGSGNGAFVPFQTYATVDPVGVRARAARYRIPLLCVGMYQDAQLQGVQLAPDPFRAHREAQCLKPPTQLLQAAKGHVADRNVRLNTPRLPVKDRVDAQVMFVGAKAMFYFP